MLVVKGDGRTSMHYVGSQVAWLWDPNKNFICYILYNAKYCIFPPIYYRISWKHYQNNSITVIFTDSGSENIEINVSWERPAIHFWVPTHQLGTTALWHAWQVRDEVLCHLVVVPWTVHKQVFHVLSSFLTKQIVSWNNIKHE